MQQRQWGFDVLRIVSMVAVVVLHTAGHYWSKLPVDTFGWETLNFYDSSVRWAVPVFVMISGALFLDPAKDQPIKKLYTRNIFRICLLIFIWGGIYAVVYHYPSELTLKGLWAFFKVWVMGDFHMWFLFMIVGLYVVTPILRCLTRDDDVVRYFLLLGLILNCIIPFLLSFGHLSIVGSVVDMLLFQTPMGYSFYFVLGYWLNKKEFGCKRSVWIGVAAVGIILTFLLTACFSLGQGKAFEGFYGNFSLPVVVASVGVFLSLKDVKPNSERAQKIITVLSRSSLGVYLIHVMALRVLRSYGISALMCPPLFSVPIVAALAVVISFVAAVVLRKIPVLGKYIV